MRDITRSVFLILAGDPNATRCREESTERLVIRRPQCNESPLKHSTATWTCTTSCVTACLLKSRLPDKGSGSSRLNVALIIHGRALQHLFDTIYGDPVECDFERSPCLLQFWRRGSVYGMKCLEAKGALVALTCFSHKSKDVAALQGRLFFDAYPHKDRGAIL